MGVVMLDPGDREIARLSNAAGLVIGVQVTGGSEGLRSVQMREFQNPLLQAMMGFRVVELSEVGAENPLVRTLQDDGVFLPSAQRQVWAVDAWWRG